MATLDRFPQLSLDELDPNARRLGDEIVAVSSAGLLGPYNVMLRSPVMAEHLKRLMDFFRTDSALPARLREFAVLIQARLWTSDVEWYSHYPAALKAGLDPAVADALKANRRPDIMQADEAAVYDVCMGMAQHKAVSDALFIHASSLLGERQLVELIGVAGTYHLIAMLLSLNGGGWPANAPADQPFANADR